MGSSVFAAEIQDGKLHVSVKKYYPSWDNPLHSEFIINGTTVGIFSSDTIVPIEEYLKPGWNDIAIKTIPQEPANKENKLIFKIGPMFKPASDSKKITMKPVLWKFDNGSDWALDEGGNYFHTAGPDVKTITLNYHVFWGGVEHENSKIKTEDYVLVVKPYYPSWNSPILTTVAVNDSPLTSFLGSDRQVILTPLLKPGKNVIRVITHKVENAFRKNDIAGELAGPAEWSPGQNKFILTPVTSFKSMQGWKKDAQTGQLNNPTKPESPYMERNIIFMVKGLEEEPKVEEKTSAPDPEFKKSAI